jgi:hypothetical protein
MQHPKVKDKQVRLSISNPLKLLYVIEAKVLIPEHR